MKELQDPIYCLDVSRSQMIKIIPIDKEKPTTEQEVHTLFDKLNLFATFIAIVEFMTSAFVDPNSWQSLCLMHMPIFLNPLSDFLRQEDLSFLELANLTASSITIAYYFGSISADPNSWKTMFLLHMPMFLFLFSVCFKSHAKND